MIILVKRYTARGGEIMNFGRNKKYIQRFRFSDARDEGDPEDRDVSFIFKRGKWSIGNLGGY